MPRQPTLLPATVHVAGPVEVEDDKPTQRCLRCDVKLPPPPSCPWPVGGAVRERVRQSGEVYATEYSLPKRDRALHPDEAHCVPDRV